MNRNRISALLFIAVGAVLGHIAATGHSTFHRSAGAQNVPAGLAGQEAPQASCSEGLNKAKLLAMAGPATASTAVQAQEAASSKQPNIVFMMGDDVGWFNIGAYHRGIMAGRTPNLDALAAGGMLFTDYYAEA
ncbi:MAG: sulfatase-like hydrolase/transferase, partial [Isosphaeraceae bacterium]